MGKITNFEHLEVWKKSHALSLKVYQISNESKLFISDYSLKNQMRRASVSITSNIAEGFDRQTDKQFSYFLRFSLASASELRSQILLARDLDYLTMNEFEGLYNEILSISNMLGSLRNYLKKSILSNNSLSKTKRLEDQTTK